MPRRPERVSRLVLFPLFFAVVAILTYLPILKGRIPFPAQLITGFPPWDAVRQLPLPDPHHAEYGDIVTLFYPWHHFQASTLESGTLPLWNPHILAGTPFLADTQSALFYPVNALFYILPTPSAWILKLLLNIVLSASFTALFVRAIGGSTAGAISAGIVFALAGNMTTWQATTLADAALWLPLICLAVHRLCAVRADLAAFALTAVAFAMPILAGHPETAAHLTLTGGAYALWLTVFSGRSVGSMLSRLGIFAAAGVVAMCLCSIQMLPTLEWLKQINHPLGLIWTPWPIREFLSLLSRDLATNPSSSGLLVPESASYAGMLTLLLVPAGLLHRNRRDAVFFLVVLLAAFQIVFGGPVRWVVDHIPVLSGLKNWRFLLVMDFSLAVLAGLGISVLSEDGPRRHLNRLGIWAGATVCGLAALAGIRALEKSRHGEIAWLHSPQAAAALLAAAYVFLLLRLFRWFGPRAFAVAAVALTGFDLVSYAYGYFPFSPQTEMYPSAPLVGFLRKSDPEEGRVANLDVTYWPNFEMMYGLQGVGGYDVGLRVTKKFVEDLSDYSLDDVALNGPKIAASGDRRIDLLNTRYLIANVYGPSFKALSDRPDRFSLVFSERAVRVFENRSVLPRAFFVPATPGAIEVMPDDDAQLNRLRDPAFDPQRSVVLPAMPVFPAGSGEGTAAADEKPEIEWRSPSPNETVLTVGTASPGVLLLSQISYPGWKAYVDGVEAPVLRADYALTGVALKPGASVVRLVYRPASFQIGSAVCGLTVFGLLGSAALSIRSRSARKRSTAFRQI